MSRRHWGVRLLVGLLLAGLLLTASPSATPAPNPFGDRSSTTTIVLHRDGSYDVTLTQTVELKLAYQLVFGGGVHDGFRLADSEAGPWLPAYLRATYALTSFTVPGGPTAPTGFTRTHHRLEARSLGEYGPGVHTAEIRYRVTDAAWPTRSGWEVYVRLLDTGYGSGDRVEIDATELAAAEVTLRCSTFPPDTEACGTSGPGRLGLVLDDAAQGLPPEFRVDVAADNAGVPTPTVDRG